MGNANSIEQKKYGWMRDLPDRRDHMFDPESLEPLIKFDHGDTVPESFELIFLYNERDNERDNETYPGNCVADSVSFAYQAVDVRRFDGPAMPSLLFVYYNYRIENGNLEIDGGASIRNMIKSVNGNGVCSSELWRNVDDNFAVKPLDECYEYAQRNKLVIEYKSVRQDINHIKSAIAKGFPVCFGFSVYESFEDENVGETGMIPLPKQDERMLGGHCAVIVGYNDEIQRFTVRSSMGKGWGDSGNCYFPYEYLVDKKLSSDFWIITPSANI